MFIWLILAGLQASASPPPIAVAAEQPASGPPLWNGLRAGMSPEQASAVLQTVSGIKAAKVKAKKNKPPTVEVSYIDQGVDLGYGKAKVALKFPTGSLQEVDLTVDQCTSAAKAAAPNLVAALQSKYGPFQRESVADENGAIIYRRIAFHNKETRVRVSDHWYNPALVEASLPGSGAAGAIADIFGAISSNAAESACPLDAGQRTTWTINYSSQAVFEKEYAQQQERSAEKLQKAKDGL